jgi:Tol biopolymer transport system component
MTTMPAPSVCARALACALAVSMLAACGAGGSGTAAPPPPPSYIAFSNVTPVTISGYAGDAMEPFISRDGRYLFFNSRNDPGTDTELFYASRVDDRTFTFLGPIPGANSSQLDGVPSLDTLGNFFFVSTRSYDATLSTLYTARFTAAGVSGVALVNGVSLLRGGSVNFDAEISPDGSTLWFTDGDYGTQGDLRAARLGYATRVLSGFAREAASDAVLATVNVGGLNYAPAISNDGLELFFTRWASTTDGSVPAIYRAARASASAAFARPDLVSAASGFVEAPSLSADGRILYFHRLVNGAYAIYCAQRP